MLEKQGRESQSWNLCRPAAGLLVVEGLREWQKRGMGAISHCSVKCGSYPDDILQFPWSLNKRQSVYMNAAQLDIQHYNSLLFWGVNTWGAHQYSLYQKVRRPWCKKLFQTWIGEYIGDRLIRSPYAVWIKTWKQTQVDLGKLWLTQVNLPHVSAMALLPLLIVVYRFTVMGWE